MQGIHFRTFTGAEDFPAMAACANASFAADGLGIVRSADDMARDYASFTACVPTRDVWIAQAGEEITGYVRGWQFEQRDGVRVYPQFGVVAPRWRRLGIGTALQSWIEARQRDTQRTIPRRRATCTRPS
ncbi:MAG: GNAT family N-acetyltransferase [Pseudomonadota bacterium]